MAAHHHHHHLHNPPTPCCSSSFGHGCTFSCNPSCDCNQTLHCPSPPLESVDPLLLQSPASRKIHAQNRRFQRVNPRKFHHQESQQRQTDFLISSLVSRIEALEASLGHFRPSRLREDLDFRYRSLRDLAARVIQTHFRAFLVRRSRTLGQLKDLALIKSAFSSLKSSISGGMSSDFYAVSRKAMDLLVKLDSIQGDDPMVRDGKRSISRDLVRFLEFIEGVCVKRHELSLRSRKNVRFGRIGGKSRVFVNTKGSDLSGDQRETIGKLRERVEKIRGYTRVSRNDDEDVVLEGFQHVSDDDEEQEEEEEEEGHLVVIREKSNPVLVNKKRVSFAENRNVLKLFSDKDEPVSNEDGTNCLDDDSTTSSDEQNPDVEEIKVFSLGTEDDGDEEGRVVNKASSRRPRSSPRREGGVVIRGHFQGRDDDEFLFSAPLPVQMEEKADLLKRRNEVKILS